jgi:hypothetical protein
LQNCGEGDEVITAETYLMDTAQVESAITEKTKCILPVHLYGQCVDMDRMLADAEMILPTTMAGNDHAYYLYDCRHSEQDRNS